MKRTILVAGAAMALALSGAAATHAATFAQYTAVDSNPNVVFTGATRTSPGELTSDASVWFDFLAPALPALGPVSAKFSLDAQESPGAFGIGPLSAALFHGNFEFTYTGGPENVKGYDLKYGDVLLQGTFKNAVFGALETSGSLFGADTTFGGGSVSYTSDFYKFDEPDQENFSINLTDIFPPVSVGRRGLTSFSADSGGSFAAQSIATIDGKPIPIGTPEPAVWMTMIAGLFGAGLALRRGRQSLVRADFR